MPGANYRDYDIRVYKKCIKCRCWKLRADKEDGDGNVIDKRQYGLHESSSDGLQSICYSCKNVANTAARNKNATARIRHHTGTRCLTQLGAKAPKQFVANLEDYLGYRITALVKALGKDLKSREGPKRKLRDVLNEGYHIDHIKPLSSFKVVVQSQKGIWSIDWDEFRKCWDISNLRAIPADENLAKGAQYDVSEHVEDRNEPEESPPTDAEAQASGREEAETTEIEITADTKEGP